MLRRCCSSVRPLAAAAHHSILKPHHRSHSSVYGRFLHIPPNFAHKHQIITSSFISPKLTSPFVATTFPFISHSPLYLTQVRHITAKQRERKLKSRQPRTPVISKVKKIKIKFYSSFKGRFRVISDGQIRRWKEGKRHNAFSKSKKSKRRLRKPGVVPLAYAKVMKKLNFCN